MEVQAQEYQKLERQFDQRETGARAFAASQRAFAAETQQAEGLLEYKNKIENKRDRIISNSQMNDSRCSINLTY